MRGKVRDRLLAGGLAIGLVAGTNLFLAAPAQAASEPPISCGSQSSYSYGNVFH